MARLCAKALEAKIEMEYVKNLIRKTKLMPDEPWSCTEAWPWPVKVYSLGRFEIHLDGKPLLRRRKAPYRVLQLLKAIIALGGQEIAISRLSDALWPDAEGDVGQETFNKTLQRLRRLLAQEQVVQVRDGKVSLNSSLCWIDAYACERLLAPEGTGTLRAISDTAWISPWERAVALYRGPFLEDEASEGWSEMRRKRLQDRVVQAGQRLIEHWSRTGHVAKAQEVRQWMREVALHIASRSTGPMPSAGERILN
jgi:DNA-binding SARP family transcriptional activator